MHIPDGMLSNTVAVTTDVASAAIVGYGVYWVRKHYDQKKVVLMAVLGALVFALQMLNFPVAGGTSGHFMGGALAGIVLGPWPAAIIMTALVAVQALIFKDGGVLALGANVMNMAVIAPFLGYFIYQMLTSRFKSTKGRVVSSAIAAWLSVVAASIVVAIQIWSSGNANLGIVLGSMAGWHAIIAIGESLITAGLIAYLFNVRPDLVSSSKTDAPGARPMRNVVITLLLIAVLAAGLSFLASSHPDGLEFVYFESGVGKTFEEFSLIGDGGIFADYGVRGITNNMLASALAGFVGLIATGAAIWLVSMRPKKNIHS